MAAMGAKRNVRILSGSTIGSQYNTQSTLTDAAI